MRRTPDHETSGDVAGIAAACAVAAISAVAFEAAFAPAVMLGAAAALLPRRLMRFRPRRRAWAPADVAAPLGSGDSRSVVRAEIGTTPQISLTKLKLGRSAAKVITFRVISTSLDFGWNYLLLGEVATAAGLSALSLGVAPLFYFLQWRRGRSQCLICA